MTRSMADRIAELVAESELDSVEGSASGRLM